MIEKKQLVFLAKFFGIFGLFHALLFVIDVSFMQHFVADVTSSMLGLQRNGFDIFIGGDVYAIVPSCTGLVSAIILASIIFSLKKPELKEKVTVFLVGVALLFVVNIFRVYFVLLAGIWFNVQIAELVHVASWFLMSGAIILAWFFFTKKITGIKDFEGFL